MCEPRQFLNVQPRIALVMWLGMGRETSTVYFSGKPTPHTAGSLLKAALTLGPLACLEDRQPTITSLSC